MSTGPVVFCCNAGPQVGLGHLMRVREMARHLNALGHQSVLYGPDLDLARPQDRELFTLWQPETPAETEGAEARVTAVLALARSQRSHLFVLDDYRADLPFQNALADSGQHWLQQFDASQTAQVYLSPVLINASPWERPEHYQGRLPNPATQLLFGPRYAVIRPEFRAITPQPDARPLQRILLSFGGGCDRGMTLCALDALEDMAQNACLVIVSGPSNPALPQIRERLNTFPLETELHVAPPDMAGLIASCDLGLIAGGTMSYELAICGVPAILVALAGNQANPCRGWQALTGAPFLGMAETLTPEAIAAAVTALASDDMARARLSAAGRHAVDGFGTERLISALLEKEMA